MAWQVAIVVLAAVFMMCCFWASYVAIKMREEDKRGGK